MQNSFIFTADFTILYYCCEYWISHSKRTTVLTHRWCNISVLIRVCLFVSRHSAEWFKLVYYIRSYVDNTHTHTHTHKTFLRKRVNRRHLIFHQFPILFGTGICSYSFQPQFFVPPMLFSAIHIHDNKQWGSSSDVPFVSIFFPMSESFSCRKKNCYLYLMVSLIQLSSKLIWCVYYIYMNISSFSTVIFSFPIYNFFSNIVCFLFANRDIKKQHRKLTYPRSSHFRIKHYFLMKFVNIFKKKRNKFHQGVIYFQIENEKFSDVITRIHVLWWLAFLESRCWWCCIRYQWYVVNESAVHYSSPSILWLVHRLK